jgi:hypothetical protein
MSTDRKSYRQKFLFLIHHPREGMIKLFRYHILQWKPLRLLYKVIELLRLHRHYGFFRSVAALRPLSQTGAPLPWFTYPAIAFLEQLELRAVHVFEFGSGNSSLFFLERVQSVTSVEDDPAWYASVSQRARPGHELLLREKKDEYVSSIAATGRRYDIIVVDGSHRFACIQQSVQCLAPGGMIILDNAEWFPQSCAFLRSQGFIECPFIGLGPINGFPWQTSCFLAPDFAIAMKPRTSFVGMNDLTFREDDASV